MMRTFVAASLVVLAGGPLLAGEVPAAMDPAAILNYQVLRPGLAVAGKPSAEALAKLKEQGFKTVIDLRMESEGIAEEKAIVEGQGLRYVSVPMSTATFKVEDAQAVGRILADDAAGPVLLHCASSNRVGAVLAVLEAKAGKPIDEAIAAGQKAGLKNESLIEAVKRVLAAPVPKP